MSAPRTSKVPFADVPESLRVHLVRIQTEMASPRPVMRDIMMELARSRVAFTAESCGCGAMADANARLWLHTHHPYFAELILAMLPEAARKTIFRIVNAADPRVDAAGFWNAASARLLQDWLSGHMPRRDLIGGNDTGRRQGRRIKTDSPTDPPKDPT